MAEPINSLESEEEPLQSDIHHVFEALGRRMAAAVPYWRYFKLARDRSAEAAVARVRARLGEIIDRTRQNRSLAISAGSKPTNLLEAMVAATAEPDSGFTDEMLIGNALTMVFAGEDTTASTLAWTLVLLAANPTAAKRLAEEADRVLEGGSTLSAEQIDRLDYTEAVLHESMRIKPTAPMLPVCANHEQRVGPVLVPAGTRLLLLTRLAWQTSGQFSAPEVFDPDRWFTHGGLTSASDPNRKMVPFGGGPRLCPGRYLAIVEMKAVLCLLAARFEFVAGDRPVDRPLDRPPDRPLEHPLDRPPNQPVAAERLAFTMKPDRVDLALRLRGRGPSAVS
jgi:cytochrome P450